MKDVLGIGSPFNTYEITKGQSRGAKAGLFDSLFGDVKEDESGQVDTTEVMGKFKAVIEVEVRTEKEEYMIKKNQLF